MSLLEWLALFVVAGVVGAVAQAVVGWSRGGCLASIGVGLLGALVGVAIARAVDLPELFAVTIDGRAFPILWSLLGSVLLVLLLSAASRAMNRRPLT